MYRKFINSDKNIHINVQEREQTQFHRVSKFKRTHNCMRETSVSFDSITKEYLIFNSKINMLFIHQNLNINYIYINTKKFKVFKINDDMYEIQRKK